MQTRAPDNEAVGPVSLYFIAFAGFVDQFDHKKRVVKTKNPAGAKKSHKHRRYKHLRPEIPISGCVFYGYVWRCRGAGGNHDVKINLRKNSCLENLHINIKTLYFLIFHCFSEGRIFMESN